MTLDAQLRELIRVEEFAPGERIGSERELAARFGVSRSAVQAALSRLEDEGAVRRAMGRHGGVLACDGKITRQLNTIEGVPAMLRQQGYSSQTTVHSVRLKTASPGERRALKLTSPYAVVEVLRRRDAGGVPWSDDRAVLPSGLFPGLTAHDLTGSLYELLATHYGRSPHVATESIDVTAAAAGRAGTLGIIPGAPVFHVRRLTHSEDGTPIELASDHFRCDRTRIQLQRGGAAWKRLRPGVSGGSEGSPGPAAANPAAANPFDPASATDPRAAAGPAQPEGKPRP